MVAAPIGLMAGGPLIELAGTSGGLVLSGVLTFYYFRPRRWLS
jgi:hypothetical protein